MDSETVYQPMFLVGESYLTLEGKTVTIVEENRERYYQCVMGDDGKWRWDREGKFERGRVTGTASYPPNPDNFINGSWLVHPTYIVNLFRGIEQTQISNAASHKAIERACVELDRLQSKLRALQGYYNEGKINPELYNLLFR